MKADRLEDLGRLREKLFAMLDMDIFNETRFLSKYNEVYWCPSNLEESEEKLDECRRKFIVIQEQLNECYSIACGDDEP